MKTIGYFAYSLGPQLKYKDTQPNKQKKIISGGVLNFQIVQFKFKLIIWVSSHDAEEAHRFQL